MLTTKYKVSKEVDDVIQRVLRERLGPHGLREAAVTAEFDHAGDPALFIQTRFDLVPGPIDTAITFGITSALRDALDEIDETRFPYVRYDFHDDQTFVEKGRKRKRA